MKLLKKQIKAKDGSGTVLLRPETSEDLWHAFNLLHPGDLVRCTTVRKLVKEGATGSTSSQKKRLMLTIRLQKVDFDPEVLQVRLSGPVVSENDFVRMGAMHTLTLELAQNFSVEKECWDQIYLDRIDEAVHPERQAEIAAVVMQLGLAHVCLVTGALTVVKSRIETNIPKKRTGSNQHEKAINKFFEAVYRAVLQHIDFTKIKCILLGSPGFVKDDFYQYLVTESVRRDDRPFIEHKSKFLLCRSSSGHKHALEELFGDPIVMSRMSDTKFAQEVEVLQKFMKTMNDDPDKAYYGFDHVSKAHEQLAIDSLLVTDELFRSSDIKTRKQYVQLVESVREAGGKVYIFSTMHVSGQQLQQVSGVAALLRYPLPDLDELEELAANVPKQADEVVDEETIHYEDPNRRLREDMEDMGFS